MLKAVEKHVVEENGARERESKHAGAKYKNRVECRKVAYSHASVRLNALYAFECGFPDVGFKREAILFCV